MASPLDLLRSRRQLAGRLAELERDLVRLEGERDAARREAAAVRVRAEAAMTAKSTYLANLSHEIRTPINAILGFSTLARRLPLPGKAGHYLKLIARSGESLRDILNDVLDLSKIEADMMQVDAVPFRIPEVLARVVDLAGHRAAEKGLEFVVAGAETVAGPRAGDPLRLGQVLTNLVTNAIKFTASGHVAVRVEPGPGAAVRFTVADSGMGLTEAQQAVVFQAFAQADSGIAREFGGTGLGLTISRRLVELMGGDLALASRPGQGAVFTFTLELPPADAPAPAVSALRPGARVLVAGTPALTQAALRGQLEAAGLEVQCAATGQEALAVLAPRADRAPVDLLLLAYRLPGLGGLETVRKVRQNPWLAALPTVLLVTPLEDEEVAVQAEREGIRVLLTLPALPGPLGEALALAAQGPAARVQDSGRIWFGAPELLREVAGARVLLVDDNAVNRELGTDLLAGAGIQVTAAASGAEALARLEGDRFDAVLLDVQMPGMDGFQLTARIRARPGGRDLPIIALTAHALAGFRERCLAAGMDDYVAKPIEAPQLFRVLNKWILGRGPLQAPGPRVPAADRFQALADLLDIPEVLGRLGDPDLLEKTLDCFQREPARPETAARLALDRGDLPGARALVHPIRGLAGTLGMARVRLAAETLEARLDQGDRTGDGAALAEFAAALGEVRARLAAHFRPG